MAALPSRLALDPVEDLAGGVEVGVTLVADLHPQVLVGRMQDEFGAFDRVPGRQPRGGGQQQGQQRQAGPHVNQTVGIGVHTDPFIDPGRRRRDW
jgi:hypothetical protein